MIFVLACVLVTFCKKTRLSDSPGQFLKSLNRALDRLSLQKTNTKTNISESVTTFQDF